MKRKIRTKRVVKRRNQINKKKIFTMVPIEIIEDKSLKLNEVIILSEIATMHHYGGEFFATNHYLADILRLSRQRVSSLVNDLIDRGYLESVQYFDPVDKITYKRVLIPNVFLDCKAFKKKDLFNKENLFE